MNCPYCNKRTSDMPNHLVKNTKCFDRHKRVLLASFNEAMMPPSEKEISNYTKTRLTEDAFRKAIIPENKEST